MSAITGPSSSTGAASSSGSGFGVVGSDEFLEVLFTELANQDPLAPSDTGEILNQLATIRSIESDLALTNSLDALVSQNETASASGLIGKVVFGRNSSGFEVEDLVVSVSVTREGPVLNMLEGQRIPMDSVEEIFDPALFAGGGGGS